MAKKIKLKNKEAMELYLHLTQHLKDNPSYNLENIHDKIAAVFPVEDTASCPSPGCSPTENGPEYLRKCSKDSDE